MLCAEDFAPYSTSCACPLSSWAFLGHHSPAAVELTFTFFLIFLSSYCHFSYELTFSLLTIRFSTNPPTSLSHPHPSPFALALAITTLLVRHCDRLALRTRHGYQPRPGSFRSYHSEIKTLVSVLSASNFLFQFLSKTHYVRYHCAFRDALERLSQHCFESATTATTPTIKHPVVSHLPYQSPPNLLIASPLGDKPSPADPTRSARRRCAGHHCAAPCPHH